MEYRERYLIDSMDRLAGMMRERGLRGIALFHNYPHPLGPGGSASGFTTPFNIVALEEKLDFVGFDIYSRKELYSHVRTIGSYVAATSRFPYIPEFIAGVWPWYLDPGDGGDEEFVTKAALMQGVKGFSRYMLVERDRWLDSPIRRDGRERAGKVEMLGRANAMLQAGDFVDLRREADVLLLANREYDRLEAAAVLVSFPGDFLETPSGFSEYPNALTVGEDTLGFDRPPQVAKSTWFSAFSDALTGSGYDHVLSDTALPPDRWRDRKVVVVTTLDYLDSATQEALVEYVRAGGTAVIGPKVPRLDSAMRPCGTLAEILDGAAPTAGGRLAECGAGRIFEVTDLDAVPGVVSGACDAAGVRRVTAGDPALDVVVHGLPGDPGVKVVFVANPTAAPIRAEIGIGARLDAVREIWDGRDVATDGKTVTELLPPYTIRIYRCVVGA